MIYQFRKILFCYWSLILYLFIKKWFPNIISQMSSKDPLEEGMATHSSILSWGIPVDSHRGFSQTPTEEPDGLESMRLQRIGQDWSDLPCTHHCFPEQFFCSVVFLKYHDKKYSSTFEMFILNIKKNVLCIYYFKINVLNFICLKILTLKYANVFIIQLSGIPVLSLIKRNLIPCLNLVVLTLVEQTETGVCRGQDSLNLYYTIPNRKGEREKAIEILEVVSLSLWSNSHLCMVRWDLMRQA